MSKHYRITWLDGSTKDVECDTSWNAGGVFFFGNKSRPFYMVTLTETRSVELLSDDSDAAV